MKKFYVYKIDWRDAAGKGGWKWIPDMEISHYDVSSIGYLVQEDKNYYVLGQSLTSEYQVGERLQIPKKWVTKVTKLRGVPCFEYKHEQ